MNTVDLIEYACWAAGTLLIFGGLVFCVRGRLLIAQVGKPPRDMKRTDKGYRIMHRGPRLFRWGLVHIALAGIAFYLPSLFSMAGLI